MKTASPFEFVFVDPPPPSLALVESAVTFTFALRTTRPQASRSVTVIVECVITGAAPCVAAPGGSATTVERLGSPGPIAWGATTTDFDAESVSPAVSVSVTVAVYVPAAAYVCVVERVVPVAVLPSPKLHATVAGCAWLAGISR